MLQCGTKPAVQPAPNTSILIADSGFCKLLSIALTGKKYNKPIPLLAATLFAASAHQEKERASWN
jgi:hypothetical protein